MKQAFAEIMDFPRTLVIDKRISFNQFAQRAILPEPIAREFFKLFNDFAVECEVELTRDDQVFDFPEWREILTELLMEEFAKTHNMFVLNLGGE